MVLGEFCSCCLLRYRIFPHLHFSWRSSLLFNQFFNCKQNENERAVRRQQAAGNHRSGKELLRCLQLQQRQSWTEGPQSCSRMRWVTITIPAILSKKKVEPQPKIFPQVHVFYTPTNNVACSYVFCGSLACAGIIEASCEGVTVLCLELAGIISKDDFWDKKSWRGTFDKGIQW